MVFQNPYSSLDPKMKIFDTLKEPLQINTDLSDEQIEKLLKKKSGLSDLTKTVLTYIRMNFREDKGRE